MKKSRSIQEFMSRIEPYKRGIYRIELFGSYARGKYKADSDIDLLVVLKNRGLRDKLLETVDSAMEAADYQELLSPVIMDERHFQKIKKLNSDFYYFLNREGKILWQAKT